MEDEQQTVKLGDLHDAAPQQVSLADLHDAPPKSDAETWAGRVVDLAKQAGHFVAEHPATSGAMALGTAMSLATGGVAAVPAAALVGLASAGGAGAGLAAKQIADRDIAPAPTVAANAKEMVAQGVTGAVGEGVGRAAAAVAKPAGRWLMDRAFNPTDRLAREFPNLSDTAIEHAITVSNGGMDKARQLLGAAKAVANGAISRADQAGASVPLSAAKDGLQITLGKIASSSDIAGDMKTLATVERNIGVGRQSTLTLTEADALKTQLQREAKIAYAASRAPNGTPALAVEAEAKKDMATTLNAAINAAAEKAGFPGYAEANGTARDLIGVNRAMLRATQSGPNVVRMMVRPGVGAVVGSALGYEEGHPGLGALAGAYATSPGSMSRLSILLSHPIAKQLLRQVPRPILQALLDKWQPTTASQQPEEEPKQ